MASGSGDARVQVVRRNDATVLRWHEVGLVERIALTVLLSPMVLMHLYVCRMLLLDAVLNQAAPILTRSTALLVVLSAIAWGLAIVIANRRSELWVDEHVMWRERGFQRRVSRPVAISSVAGLSIEPRPCGWFPPSVLVIRFGDQHQPWFIRGNLPTLRDLGQTLAPLLAVAPPDAKVHSGA